MLLQLIPIYCRNEFTSIFEKDLFTHDLFTAIYHNFPVKFVCVKGANEHDVIVYMVIKDMLSECGQPRHRFQKCPFFEGRKHQSSVNDRHNRSKSYAF